MTVAIAIEIVQPILKFYIYFDKKSEKDPKSEVQITYLVLQIVKILMDFYIVKIISEYFIFIVRIRIAHFKKMGQPFPRRSKIVVAWLTSVLVFFCIELAIFHTMAVIFPFNHINSSSFG